MTINQIKGSIEINGLIFDPKEILYAIIEQNIPIELTDNGIIIGNSLIQSKKGIEDNHQDCPFLQIFKNYGERKPEFLKKDITKPNNKLNFNPIHNANQHVPIIEEIPADDFFLPSDRRDNIDDILQMPNSARDYNRDHIDGYPKHTMKGISIPTHHGRTRDHYDTFDNSTNAGISHTTYCPNCHKSVDSNWTFCGHCGYPLK